MKKTNAIDMSGQRFGNLVVKERAGRKRSYVTWLCQCDCGRTTIAISNKLRSGWTKSCGCLSQRVRSERKEPPLIKHGHSPHGKPPSGTYSTWHGMMQRCTNPKHKQFHQYGGAGISVCERWKTFANFLHDMGERPYRKTLDRVNNDFGYSKDNCRWATHQEQERNRRIHTDKYIW